MIIAERVSMMSNTLGMTVRPTRLRSTPVRSRKIRWPASTNCGEPSVGSADSGLPSRCATPEVRIRIASMPIGVIGR